MKNFTYVKYDGSICVLVDQHDSKATIAGFMTYNHGDSILVYENDVDIEKVSPCDIEISKSSMLHRLLVYRVIHDDIFGFIDEEMTLIHPFSIKNKER